MNPINRNHATLTILWIATLTGWITNGHATETVIERTPNCHWVGTWASSAQPVEEELMPPDFQSLDNTTLRQVVRVSIGGTRLRVRFSNAFAGWADDLTISAASVAVAKGDRAVDPNTIQRLTFHGQAGVVVPYGTLMLSDPVDFDLAAGSDLAVTIHVVKAPKKITGHRSARGEVVLIQSGDAVNETKLAHAVRNKCWYFLCGVDVPAPPSGAAMVCLGDSITDGKGSTEGANRRWPDVLARRLGANPDTAHIAVLNQGIGGNALWRGGIGPTALQRIERDVLSQPGVRWVIIMEGINDLGGGKTSVREMIVAYEQIILRARERGLFVYGGTIMPCGDSFYFNPDLERKRQAINHWIRTGGAFDAVIDFDAATRDPQAPDRLLPAADSGDHLHPSDQGHRLIAETVDLKRLFHPLTHLFP